MKLYPFKRRKLSKSHFQSSPANKRRYLKSSSLGKPNNNFSSELQNSIIKSITSQTRSAQTRNINGFTNQLISFSGTKDIFGNSFFGSTFSGIIKQLLNGQLQNNYLGSERQTNIVNLTETQIAANLIKSLQKGKRNL